ncbi:MAG TPA: GTP cyclohydrolase II [Gammaproteobacteria bacterium]
MTKRNGTKTGTEGGINGEAEALGVDRALGELRRGRAIRIVGRLGAAIVAAVETIQEPLFARLSTAADGRLALLLTPQRAEAVGLASNGAAVALACHAGFRLDELRALGGMASNVVAHPTALNTIPWTGDAAIASAAFKLAKAGKLLPSLLGFDAQGLDDDDSSLVSVDVAAIERHAGLARNLKRTSQSRVPLAAAEESRVVLFRDEQGLGEHVAVVIGNPDLRGIVPVRLHSACLTGDLLGSLRCDCGEQLRAAVRRIAELGGGVLLYLDQEGRGIGLANKLRAYAIQDTGLDTVDADRHLGFHADERNYDVAAALLHELGIRRIRLLTNNPRKIDALKQHGIDVVGRMPLLAPTNTHNERYLRAKRERSGHLAD